MRLYASIFFLLTFLLSGCAADLAQKPLRFQGLSGALQPGDIVETSSGTVISFAALMDRLSRARVIYVGETHTSLEDHRLQLEVLKGLQQKDRSPILALEMFPRRVQPVLDRFAAGELDEESFLKEVQWGEVWGYPFQLYRDLLLFARDHRLRIIGLNAPRELVDKIARQGLASLDPAERGEIAERFLTADPNHREILAREYDRHLKGKIKDFDSFYEAQLAWDETMAETLVHFLRTAPPETAFLVLVGKGHILQGVGMPQAARMRFDHTFKTVVPVPIDTPVRTLSPELADYLWITPPFTEMHPPRLGIQVKTLPENQGLEIVELVPGGRAAVAGIQQGDVLVRAGDAPVRNVEDLHRILAGDPKPTRFVLKRSGKEINVEVEWGKGAGETPKD